MQNQTVNEELAEKTVDIKRLIPWRLNLPVFPEG
jgi:hypothetical protein